jgi:hypothetical protein
MWPHGLDRAQAGVKVVLTGGGAATVYAPQAYQSKDLDFIVDFWASQAPPSSQPLVALGFVEGGGIYTQPGTPYSLEFPAGPLAIGEETITEWETLEEDGQVLHILKPTDCARDRLAWFLFNGDYSGLEQVLAVARLHPVDMDVIAYSDEIEHRFRLKSSGVSV